MKPIFLSYARIDNDKDEKDEKHGWVGYVHSRLRLALSPKLGQRMDFWRDVQEIGKGASWHEEIKAALNEARVLLAVLSPSFFESENCRFELQHFLDSRRTANPRELAESVIKIFKHEIDRKVLPAEIREPEAFKFFVNHPVDGELSYYNPGTGLRVDRQQEFMDELERLANRLVALLKDSGEANGSPPSLTVFLAVPHPQSRLTELYQRVKTELVRRKVAVVPDRSRFFSVLDEVDHIVLNQAATNAQLAVHLLDSAASGRSLLLDQLQIEATASRAGDGRRLRRLIWIGGKSTAVVDNELIASMRLLKQHGGRLSDSDSLVEDSSERFIELLGRTLFPTEATRPTTGTENIWYLLVDGNDNDDARKLALPKLAERGLRARLPMPTKLAEGDRVAIYWGSRDADWVFDALAQLGTIRPILLIKGPPDSAAKRVFFAEEVSETLNLTSPPGGVA